MRTPWLHTLFSSAVAVSYLGLAVALAVDAHHSGSEVAGSPSSPVLATLRFPHAHVLQMVPDDTTGRLLVLTQATGRARGPQPVTESVVDPRMGKLLRTTTLDPDYATDSYQVDPRTGHIIFLNTGQDKVNGAAHVVDGTSGRPILTFSTDKPPFSMALDPQRGYLLIVNLLVMRAFDLRTGKPIQRAFVPLGRGAGNYFFIANPRDGLVYVPTLNGDGVLLLDELTGAVRGRVILGHAYGSFVADSMATAAFDQQADLLVVTARAIVNLGQDIFYDVVAIDGRTGRRLRDLFEFPSIGGSLSLDVSTSVGQGRSSPAFTIENDTTFDRATTYGQPTHMLGVDTTDPVTGHGVGGAEIQLGSNNADTDLQLDERARRAFLVVTSDEGDTGPRGSTLYVLGFHGGLVGHPLPLGTGAVTLGVLPRAGRVLILHHDDNTIGILDVACL